MSSFEEEYEKWLNAELFKETNTRRREMLKKGLGHGTVKFLRSIWFPIVGNFDHLYPEWEVQDLNNGYRYIDLAYMPEGVQVAIEIQGFSSHARDIDTRRFKDLCNRHCLLALDGWTIFPIAYLSIRDEPKLCQNLVLAFIGRYKSIEVSEELPYLEAEVIRLARRHIRPITPLEVANHLKVSPRYARVLLRNLYEKRLLIITSGGARARTYTLNC